MMGGGGERKRERERERKKIYREYFKENISLIQVKFLPSI
jgi:hypothetical protein